MKTGYLARYFARHLQVLLNSLGRIIRRPGSTLMTVFMLGITLALPGGLYVLLQNLNQASVNWSDQARVSVYLQSGVTSDEVEKLRVMIEGMEHVAAVRKITPVEAFREFKQYSGLGDALDLLTENPLPYTLVVTPRSSTVRLNQLQQFIDDIQGHALVTFARMDTRWLRRLQAFSQVAIRAVMLVGVFLCLAVLLIISNTIRLDILNRQDEIDIVNRVGGTGGFIRRPFLYNGCIQGILGAIVAVVLIKFGLQAIASPVRHLVGLYGSNFSLQGPGLWLSVAIISVGGALGWLASRITLHLHLRKLIKGN